jgi:hypothetical protein
MKKESHNAKDGADRGAPPSRGELVKETARLIRLARKHWDAHENGACRRERDRALALYSGLTPGERKEIPEVLLVWLRYRSEKYFGAGRTAPGTRGKKGKGEGGR